MKRLSFLVSLTNKDNDYQQEQAAAAEKAARRLGVDVKIIDANNDAVAQSQQLLHYVQDSSVARPDAILFEPAGGTAFPQVARAAAAAGIGWVVLNHEVDYILELRRQYKVPIFAISSDHQEVGKIQGQQFAALLPNGGTDVVHRRPGEQFGGERTYCRNDEDEAGKYPDQVDARELDGRERVQDGQFVVAFANFAGEQDRPGRRAGRQHGRGSAQSVQRDCGRGSGPLDEDSGDRVRRDAEDGSSLGSQRNVWRRRFISVRIPIWRLRCWWSPSRMARHCLKARSLIQSRCHRWRIWRRRRRGLRSPPRRRSEFIF